MSVTSITTSNGIMVVSSGGVQVGSWEEEDEDLHSIVAPPLLGGWSSCAMSWQVPR
jgi:hypothetical protein